MHYIIRIDWNDDSSGSIVKDMTPLLIALGILSGVLTTVSGQGGGLMLLLAASALLGPHAALAVTTPALLLGNLHRAILFRRSIDRAVARRMVAGVVPGALLGGLAAGAAPGWFLKILLIAMTVLAIAKALGKLSFRVPTSALGPAGFGLGAMMGTAGGAGVLNAPVLLAYGLRGGAFIGTSATIAFAGHAGRIVGYSSLGLFTGERVLTAALVALAIFAGNALGERIRARALSENTTTRLEYGMLVVCVALSVLGIG
jgi:uncharacterized membrane protein YfcA